MFRSSYYDLLSEGVGPVPVDHQFGIVAEIGQHPILPIAQQPLNMVAGTETARDQWGGWRQRRHHLPREALPILP
jgi:hypothetical protein